MRIRYKGFIPSSGLRPPGRLAAIVIYSAITTAPRAVLADRSMVIVVYSKVIADHPAVAVAC